MLTIPAGFANISKRLTAGLNLPESEEAQGFAADERTTRIQKKLKKVLDKADSVW